MKNKKKKLISILLALSCLFVVVLVTLAAADNAEFYSPTARNFITTNGVHIALHEVFDGTEYTMPGEATVTSAAPATTKPPAARTLSKAGELDVQETGTVAVVPGLEVEKKVWVENIGAKAWIRVKVLKRVTLAGGEIVTDTSALMELAGRTPDAWVEPGDGWYYCRMPVETGESTPYLFTAVKFSENLDNTYQGSTAEILIVAQAVQTAHNADDGNGGTVTRAVGWPEDPLANSGQIVGPVDPVNPDPGNNGGGNEP